VSPPWPADYIVPAELKTGAQFALDHSRMGDLDPPVVAIVNSNDDVVEMLRLAFEQAGMVVVSAHVDQIKRGVTSLADFVAEHNPKVVLFDLVPPYDRSWRFVEHLTRAKLMNGRRFVITSANARMARELSGTSEEVFEIVGKPYDISQITDAVKQASRARPTK
jgi:DNA-binding NtrC family response regulator